MNLETGELIRLMGGAKAPEGFVPVPNELSEIAEKALGNKNSVFLPPEHPLRANAQQIFKISKKKARRQIKESKKRNRRK